MTQTLRIIMLRLTKKIQSMDELIALVQSKLDKGEFVGAQVNISNNTVIDGIGKINEDELVYKSEDSTYAITIGNNVLC